MVVIKANARCAERGVMCWNFAPGTGNEMPKLGQIKEKPRMDKDMHAVTINI